MKPVTTYWKNSPIHIWLLLFVAFLNSNALSAQNTCRIDINIATTSTGCNKKEGTIKVTTLGGASPFQFRIVVGNNQGTFQNSNIFTGLGIDFYTVEVKMLRAA